MSVVRMWEGCIVERGFGICEGFWRCEVDDISNAFLAIVIFHTTVIQIGVSVKVGFPLVLRYEAGKKRYASQFSSGAQPRPASWH